ncbi:MAG: UDP-3-O-(3-hydroxymyristoyl)glucosamine N-acyltransferase, partial [Candidatus Electrothrix sp. AW1]|nr:UDP-3-O-(3-hydroxymyristoyl)glucosamine N-acyltransferase [Candidatus Electrothrix gigas]
MKQATLGELAALVQGNVLGDDQLKVSTVNSLELAEPGQLTFINSVKLADKLAASKASA